MRDGNNSAEGFPLKATMKGLWKAYNVEDDQLLRDYWGYSIPQAAPDTYLAVMVIVIWNMILYQERRPLIYCCVFLSRLSHSFALQT